jgi:2-keto-4-pentenoate hydratase
MTPVSFTINLIARNLNFLGGPLHSIISTEQAIATKFVSARQAGVALATFPGDVPRSMQEAYCVQDFAIAQIDDAVAGWKVGRVFPPWSIQYGCDRLTGPIFKSAVQIAAPLSNHENASRGLIYAGGFGAAEAEFLLRIGTTPKAGQLTFSLAEAAALVDAVHVGIEIASSPLPTINDFGPAVTASDFGNNNGLLVGAAIADWQSSDFANWIVSTAIDDVEIARGSASVFPDGPIGSVRFLLEHLAQRGIAVRPGMWVSTGAVTGVHNVRQGQRVTARFTSSLSVSCVVAEVARRN